MAGKPGYDEAAVITQAVRTFWTRGYAGTSVADLVEATGLSRSSLYQRFVDKDGLYLEALGVYHARVIDRMTSVAAEHPSGPVEAILRDFAPGSPGPARPSGCLVARSCIESPSLPDRLRKAALKCIKEQHKVFVDQLQLGGAKGHLPRGIDPQSAAWYYLGIFHTVLNMPLTGASSKEVDSLIQLAVLATRGH